MTDLGVGVGGSGDLQKKFDDLRKKATPQQLTKALIAGAEVLKEAIVERTPVRIDSPSGDALKPGELRENIVIKVSHGNALVVKVKVGPTAKTARVMNLLEFGHRIAVKLIGKARSIGGGEVPAYPVMRPAWEASHDDSLKVAIESLKDSEN